VDGATHFDRRESPPPRPANGADRQATAFFDRQLIEAMRSAPGASVSALGAALGVGRGAIISRVRRLAARGLVRKCRDDHWRVAERERPTDAA
jgi:DNA-binding GntR family transcriptional regulator